MRSLTPGQTEQYRRECEARWVLSLPHRERKPWLDAIGRRRGPEAQKYLEEEVIRQFRLKKGVA